VDDNPTNRRILNLQAQTWGMKPVEADSPTTALALVRQGRPFDLAVLDMHLPEMDGAQLASALCQEHERQGQHFPLVMLTSLGYETRPELEAVDCFSAYLTKPVKPSQLYDVLVSVLVDEEREARHTPGLAANPAPRPNPLAEQIPLRILLAEDVAVNQKFALLALEEMGYTADVAANGQEVLEALKRQPYDAILMDVQMPVMDGLTATRRIRQDPSGLARPYIIAMTANAMQGDRELCLEAGMDDYISKPVYQHELRAVLERAGEWLKDYRRWHPLTASDTPQTAFLPEDPTTPLTPAIDPAVLDKLLNRPSGRELVLLYLAEAPDALSELRQAVEQQQAVEVRQAAHKLKGSSSYVGAWRVTALSAELEQEGRRGTVDGVASALLSQLEDEYRRAQQALQKVF
jgi:CheY-like chemotaxis protein/HPt (histidine-containing phosphotransfer) domain-containing protein